jgi:hypothetical protein
MTLNIGQRTSSATGGSISTISGYTVHTFTSSGNFVPTGSGTIEVLVVGGGGGAGTYGGGGGGAVAYNKFVNVTSGTPYSITVGAAGGGISTAIFNNATITAYGGGNGTSSIPGNGIPSPNASGGGGSGASGIGGIGAGVTGLGFPGAAGGGGYGGGGGASSSGNGGNGGIGVSYSITGTSLYYGGGGGGYAAFNGGLTPTSYGTGGGFNASAFPIPATPGAVIIRYPT